MTLPASARAPRAVLLVVLLGSSAACPGPAPTTDAGHLQDGALVADSSSGDDVSTSPDAVSHTDAANSADVASGDLATGVDLTFGPDVRLRDAASSATDAFVNDISRPDSRFIDVSSAQDTLQADSTGAADSAAPDRPVSDSGQQLCAMGLPAQLGELTAEQLYQALQDKDFLLINVADSTGNQIPGTDTFIPHSDTDALVAYIGDDLSVKVVLYCNSSNRSGIAGRALVALGYCQISHLLGGRNAWAAAGYAFD